MGYSDSDSDSSAKECEEFTSNEGLQLQEWNNGNGFCVFMVAKDEKLKKSQKFVFAYSNAENEETRFQLKMTPADEPIVGLGRPVSVSSWIMEEFHFFILEIMSKMKSGDLLTMKDDGEDAGKTLEEMKKVFQKEIGHFQEEVDGESRIKAPLMPHRP